MSGQPKASNGGTAATVVLRPASDVVPQPIDWLWRGWLAAGKLHILGGAPGTGKTTVALNLAATLTRGGRWPDGTTAPPGAVVIWSGEDDDGDTLNPRLRAAGADLSRVHVVGPVVERERSYPFDPSRDLEVLRDALVRLPPVRLIIIDPIVSAVSGDSHKNAEVRRGLQPLVDLANDLGVAVLGITHFSKGTAGRDPLERITGSLAYGALARIVWATAKQDGDGDRLARRVLVRAKSNIGADGGGFAYDLRHERLQDFPDVEASHVVWGEAIDGSARDLLADAESQGEEVEEQRDAASWLRELLAQGELPVRDVRRYANDAGHAWRTVQRAGRKLGAVSTRRGFGGAATWRLPNRATHAALAPVAPLMEAGASGATGVPRASLDEGIEL